MAANSGRHATRILGGVVVGDEEFDGGVADAVEFFGGGVVVEVILAALVGAEEGEAGSVGGFEKMVGAGAIGFDDGQDEPLDGFTETGKKVMSTSGR